MLKNLFRNHLATSPVYQYLQLAWKNWDLDRDYRWNKIFPAAKGSQAVNLKGSMAGNFEKAFFEQCKLLFAKNDRTYSRTKTVSIKMAFKKQYTLLAFFTDHK